MPDLDGKIAQANGRLKAAKVGVSIERHGDRLYLRATFPPKPNSKKSAPYQQRVSIAHANHNGVQYAEKEARKVGALLDSRQFEWVDYLKPTDDPLQTKDTIEWVEQARHQHFCDRKSEVSWEKDYWEIYRRLPLDQPLTLEEMMKVIEATAPNTKTRKRACMALGRLAKIAGIPADFKAIAGSYSSVSTAPRNLPNDAAIAQFFGQIANPAWRWVYGMIAAYGLRPHEVFRLEHDRLARGDRIVRVKENTKTGYRLAWCFYPEWFDQFDLSNVLLPNIKLERSNSEVGASASGYFNSIKSPFNLYDLRHRWAIRTLEFGLDISLAARQMGHSLDVHSKTYHHWITEDTHQKAYEVLLANPNRPPAP